MSARGALRPLRLECPGAPTGRQGPPAPAKAGVRGASVHTSGLTRQPSPPTGESVESPSRPTLFLATGDHTLRASAPGAGSVEAYESALTQLPDSELLPLDNTPESDRLGWLGLVEDATREHRRRRASQHRRAAARHEAAGRVETAEWHRRRARGQLERVERVRDCGREQLSVSCRDCGTEATVVPASCSAHRLCWPCRARRVKHYTRRFKRARHHALLRKRRHERERFVTLTVPHSGDVASDAREIRRAWPRFLRALRLYCGGRLTYVKATEIAWRDDAREGHVHLHVWALSAYLPQRWLAEQWTRALSHSYRERARATSRGVAVVDVRAARSGVERELIKYLVKDARWSADGRLAYVDADTYGALYAALDGARCVVASVRFWRPEVIACDCCGGQLRPVRITPPEPYSALSAPPRAPPSLPVS